MSGRFHSTLGGVGFALGGMDVRKKGISAPRPENGNLARLGVISVNVLVFACSTDLSIPSPSRY